MQTAATKKHPLTSFTLVVVIIAAVAFAGTFYYYNETLDRRLAALSETVGSLKEQEAAKDRKIAELEETVAAVEQETLKEADGERTALSSLVRRMQPKIDPGVADSIARSMLTYSKEFKIPPELLLHIMKRESSFRLILESNKRAKGLMQVMPKAHPDKMKALGLDNYSVFHIDNNIHMGAMILAEYFESKKSIYGALESYVGGEHKSYIYDILVGYTNTTIHQFRTQPEEEQQVEEEEPEVVVKEQAKPEKEPPPPVKPNGTATSKPLDTKSNGQPAPTSANNAPVAKPKAPNGENNGTKSK